MPVREIPYHTGGGGDDGPNPRVETGAVRFGDDWPGLFIRGDDAFYVMQGVQQLIREYGEPSVISPLYRLKCLAETIRRDVIQGPANTG